MVKKLSEEELRKNAKEFETLYLLPNESNDRELDLRLEVNSKWKGGWMIRAEFIKSFGLNVGDTILANVKPIFLNGLIDHDDEVTLFAGSDVAQWIIKNKVTKGTIIDCHVKFLYSKVSLGVDNEEIYNVLLILENVYGVVPKPKEEVTEDNDTTNSLLKEILGTD